MSATSTTATIRDWVTAQRQVTIFAAIIVAVLTAYVFQSAVNGDVFAGSFFLILLLAVGVPSAYDDYWPHYNQTTTAVVWVLAACAVATVEFTVLYLAGTALIEISWVAPVGAFLITYLGNLAILAAWQRRR